MKSILFFMMLAVLNAMASPEWLGNKLGTGHEAPPPFEKVTASGNTVRMWGKEFTLNAAALPQQVRNQQQEMLTTPAVIFYEKEKDKEVYLTPVPGSLKLVESHDDYAVFEGKAADASLTCLIRTELHFDGFVRMTVKSRSPDAFTVKRFGIAFPFRPDVIGPHFAQQFMGYSPDLIRNTWGQVKKPRNFPFANYLSFAGLDTSFTFLVECPRTWFLQRKSRVFQVIPGEDDFLFKANFVDVFGNAPAGGRTIDFGMLFGPARPPVSDSEKYLVNWWEPTPVTTAKYAKLGLKPLVLLWPFSLKSSIYQKYAGKPYGRASRVSFNIPEPENPAQFREWMRETATAGGIVCPYLNTDNFDPLRSPGKEYLAEWAGKPIPDKFQQGELGFAPTDGFYVCHRSKTWADYYVYAVNKLAEEYGYQGYYIDNCGSHACENPDHGPECKPYIDESGRAWARKPIFETRNLYVRIYKALKQKNPDFIFFVNGGMYYPLWEFSMSAEYLTRIAGDTQLWPEFVDKGDLEGMFFRGQQYGPLKFIYPAYAAPNITPRATRAMLSLTLHGNSAYQLSLCDTRPIEKWYEIQSKFKTWESEFVPYWRNSEFITSSGKNVLISLYRKPNEALVVASRPWGDKATVSLSIAAYRIFPGYTGKIEVSNMESGETIKIESGMYFENRVDVANLTIGKMDYVMLGIRKVE